jgi:excisionase family DNA binding protein
MAAKRRLDPPKLALSVEEACASLGVSHETWTQYVAPSVKLVRIGRRKLIPVTELQAWLTDHAERLPAELEGGRQ